MSTIMANKVDSVNQSSDDDVLELVHAVMHDYRSLQYRFLRDGPHAITHMDGKVLAFFARHPGATQRDLAKHSGRDKAQLARLVKGLREQGLLAAAVDEDDRRVVRLSLSTDGNAVVQALQRQARRLGARAVGGFDPAERAQLVDLLKRLKANLGASSNAA
jgi:DNA-binding MarR family transcriptional regulator